MKTLIRAGLLLMTPYLVFVYWRNTFREVNDIHANYELQYE